MHFKMNYCSTIIVFILLLNFSLGSLLFDLLKSPKNILNLAIKQFIEEPSDTIFVEEEYDFIIVGAGTSGCVVARRLAENPNWNVLLIEAGGRENFYADIPALAPYLRFTSMDWQYFTIPSPDGKYCASFKNGQCTYNRGKVVGGSSAVNFQFYTRGHRDNFDEWARLGNKGWSFDDVLPYFKKLETFNVPENVDMSYHGTDGPLHVGYPSSLSEIGQTFIEASKQFGFNYNDYDGEKQIGVSRVHTNINNGVRESSSRAYLHPIRNQKNFHLKKLSHVKRILIDPETKEAYGVEYVNAGQTYQVKARKEVILSAGSINSPQILMLSGIGPKDHLNEKNIKVIQDLPVGQSSMDHILANPFIYLINDKNVIINPNLHGLLEYSSNFTGPFSTSVLMESLVFTNVNDVNNTKITPNIEIVMVSSALQKVFHVLNSIGFPRNVFNEMYSEIKNKISFALLILLIQPKSRGQILLHDNKYDTPPIIAPNYFGVDEDLDTIVNGVQFAKKIAEQEAFKRFNATLWNKKVKKCQQFSFNSKKYLECSIKQISFAMFHMVGTCRMGPDNDTLAVVDDRLRVKGVKNLRVIDASIMPHIPSGHTNAASLMIGEKGADLVKENYN